MKKPIVSTPKTDYSWAYAACSGLLTAWAFMHFNEWVALVALVPLLKVMQSSTRLARLAIPFGLGAFMSGFFWMVTSWHQFTGLHTAMGLLPMALATLIMTGSVLALFFVFEKMRLPTEHPKATWLNPLALASLWTLMEFGRLHLFAGFPFFAFHTGFPLANNLVALQPVSVFGFSIMTFVVVYFNALLAQAFVTRQLRALVLPLVVLGAYCGLGFVLLQNIEKQQAAMPEVKTALLCPNLNAEFKWDAVNGDVLVKKLFAQYQVALQTLPDLVVWPESVVAWQYAPDDPFLLELKRLTMGKATRNIFGIATPTDDPTLFYNSAYLLEPDGSVAARYDKRLPLAMLEARFFGYELPFRTLGDMTGTPGTKLQTLPTPQGNAGVMICNESVMPNAAASMANAGATFLVNMSNDGWFANTYIPLQHFYNARVRAVETRRDMLVNSNQGYCGSISASGKIGSMSRATTPQLLTTAFRGCSIDTLASRFPFIWVSVLAVFSLLFLIFKFSKR